METETIKYQMQKCQDELLTTKFRELHYKLVNDIISFCKENNIVIDECYLSTDGLRESIPTGEWQSCTDSCLRFDESIYAEIGKTDITKVTNKEYKNAESKHKPFLISL